MPEIEFIARGLVMRGNSVLICRNRAHNYGFLPGGHVEFGESAATAVAREIEEEAGLSCKVGPLLFISENTFHSKRVHHEVNWVFHVEHLGDDPMPPLKVESREPQIQFEWVDLAAVVDDDIRPAEIKAWLAAGAEGSPIPMVSAIATL